MRESIKSAYNALLDYAWELAAIFAGIVAMARGVAQLVQLAAGAPEFVENAYRFAPLGLFAVIWIAIGAHQVMFAVRAKPRETAILAFIASLLWGWHAFVFALGGVLTAASAPAALSVCCGILYLTTSNEV